MCPAGFAERLERSTDDTASERSVQAPASTMMVGAADDYAEREADRVAGEVIARLHGFAGETHTHSAHCGHGQVRRSTAPAGGAEVGLAGGAVSESLTSRIESRRGGGSALPATVRRRLESGFGGSLADVRIHTDGEAARLSRAVSARAFTTGKDIFFGAGEFRPDTPEGEHVLAHEVAHTRQPGGDARRTLRRWNIKDKKIDWSKTRSVGTIKSGQAVFFLDDGSGRMVVKAEDAPIGLAQLSTVMHESLSNVKSVQHRKLDAADKKQILPLITDPSGALLERGSWAALGKEKRTVGWVVDDLEKKLGKPKGGGIDEVDDVEVGRFFHEQYLTMALGNSPFMAMTDAGGQRADAVTTGKDANPMRPEKTRMRGLMTDWKHLLNLGQLTAVDLFMNNHDRAFMVNLGNWFYDPYSATMTVIDHVDATVPKSFKKIQGDSDMEESLKYLKSSELGKTATKMLTNLSNVIDGHDAGFAAWLKADGGYRWSAAEEGLERGLAEGRRLIVKTFGATRFSMGTSGKQARATKKAIKKAAKDAMVVDHQDGDQLDPERYYKILKARAEWVKKN